MLSVCSIFIYIHRSQTTAKSCSLVWKNSIIFHLHPDNLHEKSEELSCNSLHHRKFRCKWSIQNRELLSMDDIYVDVWWCLMLMFHDYAWWWHSSSTVVRYECFATNFCLSQSEEAFLFAMFFWLVSNFHPASKVANVEVFKPSSIDILLWQTGPIRANLSRVKLNIWSSPFGASRTTKLNLSENFGDSIPFFIYRIFWKVQLYEGHNHQTSYWNMSLYFRMALKCSLQSELHVSYIFTAFNSATIPSWGPHSSVRSKDPLIASILELIENLRSSEGCFWVVSFGTWFSSSTGHISTIHVFKWTLSFDKF